MQHFVRHGYVIALSQIVSYASAKQGCFLSPQERTAPDKNLFNIIRQSDLISYYRNYQSIIRYAESYLKEEGSKPKSQKKIFIKKWKQMMVSFIPSRSQQKPIHITQKNKGS